MKKNVILLICLAFFIPLAISTKGNGFVEAINCSAEAMCVIEKDSGRVLQSKNMNKQLKMASTTKIVTAITAIENCDNLNKQVEVSNRAIGVEGSSIYLKQGERMSLIDLLYGLMLRSGNDSAVAIACYIAGDEQDFAKLMNKTAQKAGAVNSNFINPHGLDHPEHYTTACDLAKITTYALKNETFKQIVSSKSYSVEETNCSPKRYWVNKNRLLSSLSGCIGVKTGYTTKAGRCLVSAIERNNTIYVCVVLNCGPMFEESTKLLDHTDSQYKNIQIIDKNREIFNEYIIDKQNGKLFLYAEEDYYYPLNEEEKDNLILKYNVQLDNAKENDCVGEIKIFLNNCLLKTIKLFTMNKIDKLINNETLEISEVLWEEKINEN